MFGSYDDWKCRAPVDDEEPEPEEQCECAGDEHGTDCPEFEPPDTGETMDDLEQQLEASIGKTFVPRYALPLETECHSVHAQLARGVRESKRFVKVEITREDDDGSE